MNKTIKRLYNRITGRFKHIKKGICHQSKWYGNKYGGFFVIPDLIHSNSIIYSFGIGKDISFDSEIIEKHGCEVFGFDPTPKSIKWCQEQVLPKNFHLHEYGIASETGLASFYLPQNKNHISGSIVYNNNVSPNDFISVDMKAFKDIATELNHDKVDLVKIDIEGAEYDVLDNILQSSIVINQLVIEFHERFFKDGKDKTIKSINTLNKKGYEVFAVSDSFEEVSFVRTKALKQK
ncbi:FkbM family methyltransferase [Fulvivirga sp. M361]|uniref:FkbM family methyltransferase n=1 Tax=Fulvivirga sp. M361 TaxID=2594266 RepID=UPI00117AAB45|nr:FkbM family methyltransferase [Fulvivirga sp. M361]TRX51650.1 FkbM family methyltransferase [Fulvivirga sp. M361]